MLRKEPEEAGRTETAVPPSCKGAATYAQIQANLVFSVLASVVFQCCVEGNLLLRVLTVGAHILTHSTRKEDSLRTPVMKSALMANEMLFRNTRYAVNSLMRDLTATEHRIYQRKYQRNCF